MRVGHNPRGLYGIKSKSLSGLKVKFRTRANPKAMKVLMVVNALYSLVQHSQIHSFVLFYLMMDGKKKSLKTKKWFELPFKLKGVL